MNSKKSNIFKILARIMLASLAGVSNDYSVCAFKNLETDHKQDFGEQYVGSLINQFNIKELDDIFYLLGLFTGILSVISKNNNIPSKKKDLKLSPTQIKIASQVMYDLKTKNLFNEDSLINLRNAVQNVLDVNYPGWKSILNEEFPDWDKLASK